MIAMIGNDLNDGFDAPPFVPVHPHPSPLPSRERGWMSEAPQRASSIPRSLSRFVGLRLLAPLSFRKGRCGF